MRRLVLFAMIVAVISTTVSCGDSSLSAPEPGSMADRMCDTNETGPGYVTKGGKSYDEKCLDNFPWNAD